jgi:hypothetical protein
MNETNSIKKIKPDPEGLDFKSLKTDGIALLQQLSGRNWTDYNLHDPGVTILEVLCYALTDMAYRTDFDVADFLTTDEGGIDFERQALFRPEDIFPSQAVTLKDYRKILFDAIPNIENVWIETVQSNSVNKASGPTQGLYCIAVMLVEGADEKGIIDQVRQTYAANRNLCEDLLEMRIIERDNYSLRGVVEIGGDRNPDDILAEIYFRSSKYLCPGLKVSTHTDLLQQGKRPEEIFSGPLTRRGVIDDDDLDHRLEYALISELIGIISEIDGVTYVDNLFFKDGLTFIEYDLSKGSMPCLHFPENESEIFVKLQKKGRLHTVSLKSVRAEYERLTFEKRNPGQSWRDIAVDSTLPQGEVRSLADYTSIQHHFPEIYGIGQYGVPVRTPKDRDYKVYNLRKSQARQLKAYLLLFDQVMANFMANLKGMARLYSIDETLQASYFHQALDNQIVPEVEELYHDEPTRLEGAIEALVRRYDNFGERRNRILDYLLALYGEHFRQHSLRHFKGHASQEELEQELIKNKLRLLTNIRDLSRKRAGAYNYQEKAWGTNNVCSLKKKVSILLGLKSYQNCDLAGDDTAQEEEGFYILEHILLRPLAIDEHKTTVPENFFSFTLSVLFPAYTARFTSHGFRKLAQETVRLNAPAHILALFYWLDRDDMGVFEKNYRTWLAVKCDPMATTSQVDACSIELIDFLRDHQGKRIKDAAS